MVLVEMLGEKGEGKEDDKDQAWVEGEWNV